GPVGGGAGAGLGQRRPDGRCHGSGRYSTSRRRRARERTLASQPLDRDRDRAHRGTHTARPALGAALYRSAPNRGRRRRRGHVHLLPAEADRLVRSAGPIKVRRLAAGPLVAALEARFEIGRRVGIRLVVTLYADSPTVRCILDIDNQATWHRLRARVPTGLAGATAVAGTAFGSVARPPVVVAAADYPIETPVRTAPAHGFVAAASGARGLAIVAPGFF